MSDAIGTWAAAVIRGIPYRVSKFVPLHRTYRPTGAVMADVACVRVGGGLLFHPQRLAELQAAAVLASPRPDSAEVYRWADDGGREP